MNLQKETPCSKCQANNNQQKHIIKKVKIALVILPQYYIIKIKILSEKFCPVNYKIISYT
jgi:hypothetical protein